MTFPESFRYVKQPPIWQRLSPAEKRQIRKGYMADRRGNMGPARLAALIEAYAPELAHKEKPPA